jgi:hypothetical protein
MLRGVGGVVAQNVGRGIVGDGAVERLDGVG